MSNEIEKSLIQIQAKASCAPMLSDHDCRKVLNMIHEEAQKTLEGINQNKKTQFKSNFIYGLES